MQLPDVRMPSRAELRALPDSALLAQLRRLPRDSIGREAICEILVSRYTGLVRSCVRPYLQSPEPTEDLLQVGYVGLLKAINNFDPDCGDSLAAPDDRELASYLGVSDDDVRHAREAHLAFATHSLDAPLSGGDDPALLVDILGEDDPAVAHAIDIEAVRVHLDELPEREQRVLIWRFYGNLTQSQIGDRLGISQMHVSRLLDRALTYLRAQITGPA